ncbi:MAG: 5-(carboxyamino)imidazole ribonucleotide synthase [Candidatus Berkiella sp.]
MKIGILGAGQLSRMLALSSIPMGFDFIFYDKKLTNSVKNLGEFIEGSYSDHIQLEKFAKECDIITYENENIPYQTIEFLESYKTTYPNSQAIKLTQDKLLEKQLFHHLGIPTAPNKHIHSIDDAINFAKFNHYPFFIKKRTDGYDGRGLIKITNEKQLLNLDNSQLVDTVCEKFIAFEREVSLIAVISKTGHRAYYDLCENTHSDGILHKTTNIVDDPIYNKAKMYTDLILDYLGYIGCIAFEFFQIGNDLLANEIAPRVHNSGHWTIEGAFTSQFENHIRAITGLPLGNTATRYRATMYNIIGTMLNPQELLKDNLCFFHDYKKEPKPGRKLGHYTVVN